jgi:hypothetical protein
MATQTKGSSSEHSRQPSNDVGGVVASPDTVAVRAYELFQARGGEPGRDLDDWLRAEQELQGARRQ